MSVERFCLKIVVATKGKSECVARLQFSDSL